VPDVRNDGEADGGFFEILGGRRPANAAAVFLARVFGDCLFSSRRHTGKELACPDCEALDEILILVFPALGGPESLALANLGVGETFATRLRRFRTRPPTTQPPDVYYRGRVRGTRDRSRRWAKGYLSGSVSVSTAIFRIIIPILAENPCRLKR
jgi:hypothetical protein